MTDHVPREAQRAALLAEIPPEDLAAFDAYYQGRLQQAQTEANAAHAGQLEPDPDLVEETLIAALIREADGRDHPEGLGLVPSEEGSYEIIPPEDDPRLVAVSGPKKARSGRSGNAPAGAMTPARWAMIVGLILVPILWLAWTMVQPSGTSDTAAGTTTTTPTVEDDVASTPTPIADVAGGEVTVAYPASLELASGDTTTVFRVQASAAKLGGTWQPKLQPGIAAWLNGSYVNHIFCVGPDATAVIGALTRGDPITMRPASGAVRTYTVIRTREVGRQEVEVMDQRRAGLTLILCDQGGNTRTIVEAAYQPPQPSQPTVSRGQPASIPDLARFTVQTVQTVAPTTTTPTGYAEVELVVQVDNQTDEGWTSAAVADQLLVGGIVAEVLGVEHDQIDPQQSRRVTYRYLVPAAGGAATWRATAPSGDTIAVAVTIPATSPPVPSYTATLDAAGVQLDPTRSGQTIRVPFTVVATGDDPVLVPLSAAQVWIGGRSIPLSPATSGLPTTVRPLSPTTILLAADLPDIGQIEIQLGAQRWRLTLP